MKNYRVKVRNDKAEFFEELMRYLDFLDYEMVEGFSEPRIYSSFEIRPRDKKDASTSKDSNKMRGDTSTEGNLNNLRDVMQKIDAIRDKSKRK